MGVTMHAKSDSETSIEASAPPSPRRPLYYVQSPAHSHHEHDKLSYGSGTPFGSPVHNQHYHYHCSPIHHSRESSTSRFSAAFRNPGGGWRRVNQRKYDEVGRIEDEEEGDDGDGGHNVRCYVVCFLLSFVVLFTIFSLILWGASLPYKPKIIIRNIVFNNFNVQAGMDRTGVPTDMLTLNSTVKIFYRNPATFFGVHVTSTPFQLRYSALKLATGYMKKFYQSRKGERIVSVVVQGHQVPLYGGIPILVGAKDHLATVSVPVNLTFVMRSRAYILGRLVKPKFYSNVTCEITLRSNHLGKPVNLTRSGSCVYH